MKKLLTVLLAVCMLFSLSTIGVFAQDVPEEDMVPIQLLSGSKLTFDLVDANRDDSETISITKAESLGYEKIELPYGFQPAYISSMDISALEMSVSEEMMETHDISAEALPEYLYYLREKFDYGKLLFSENGGEYQQYWYIEQFTIGANYTIVLGDGMVIRPKDVNSDVVNRSPEVKRYARFTEDAKFAFYLTNGPEFLGDDATTITVGDDKDFTVKFDVDISEFENVKLGDTVLVKDTDYTVTAGSTVITLSGDVLKNLPVGQHRVTYEFANGIAAATITVNPKPTTTAATTTTTAAAATTTTANGTATTTTTVGAAVTTTADTAKTTTANAGTKTGVAFPVGLLAAAIVSAGVAGAASFKRKK